MNNYPKIEASNRPNSSDGLIKPEDPAAVLYIPTYYDADRVEEKLREIHQENEEIERNDETLWAELAAQMEKQRKNND